MLHCKNISDKVLIFHSIFYLCRAEDGARLVAGSRVLNKNNKHINLYIQLNSNLCYTKPPSYE